MTLTLIIAAIAIAAVSGVVAWHADTRRTGV
jgi:hypothetical protein